MRIALIACLILLSACARPGPVVAPQVSGGNPADGIVTLSSTRMLYDPVRPDRKSVV